MTKMKRNYLANIVMKYQEQFVNFFNGMGGVHMSEMFFLLLLDASTTSGGGGEWSAINIKSFCQIK